MYGYPLAVVVVMVASLTLLLVHLGNTSSEERDDDDYPSSTAAARDWRIRMAAFVSFVRIMCRWRWRGLRMVLLGIPTLHDATKQMYITIFTIFSIANHKPYNYTSTISC